MTPARLDKIDWLIVATLVLGVLAIYGQTIGFDFVNFDDDQYVYENPEVTRGLSLSGIRWAFTTGHASNWHPLTWLSHMTDADLFGPGPAGPHAVNLALHAASAAILFVVLNRFTASRWPAAACAALFAWHPLRVESVAWVAERKDVLSGLFFMLTLLVYERYVRRPATGSFLLLAGVFAAGLMSKPMLVTVPLVLLLLDVWPLSRHRSGAGTQWPRLLVEKLPLLALSLGCGLVTIAVQQAARSTAGLTSLPMPARVANAVCATVAYLWQWVWPAGLAPFYPHPYLAPVTGLSPLAIACSAGILIVFTVVSIGWVRRCPWLLVGWLWFLIMLVPVLGILQVGRQAHADRYTYLPTIGLCVAVCWSAAAVAARWSNLRWLVQGVLVASVLTLGGVAFLQTRHWRDSERLWGRAIAVTRANATSLNNLGQALTARGDNQTAITLFQRAVSLDPKDARALENLATQFLAVGNDNDARPLLRRALQADPTRIEAYSKLAGVYLRMGRPDDALLLYRQAVSRDPGYADGHYNIAVTLAQQGKFDAAADAFTRVLELRPDDPEAQAGLQAAQRARAAQPGGR